MPLFLIGREALEHPKIRTHRLNVTNPGGKMPRECHNPPMTRAAPARVEQEFWLLNQAAPLPAAEPVKRQRQQQQRCFRLNLSGAPENAPDHVLEGEYLDEEGESQLDVFWVMETDDARQAFKRDRSALRQIGDRTKMLRFILEDECALGHVFAMIHAILEHRDGLLVIPDDRGNVILERRQALEFLSREIRED
ncbi:hypothetical protein [Akkermansia massiliensis]